MLKKPVVAGSFYPATQKELDTQLDAFFKNVAEQTLGGRIIGLISPHAGYQYSGQVAAYGYKLISSQNFKSVIIIAPCHNEAFEGVSVWSDGYFETPLGRIEVDSQLAGKIMAKDTKKIRFYKNAYAEEHSLEVQLPFLQKSLKNFTIVPIIVGEFSYSICDILCEAISDAIGQRKDVLIIASTDLSHYHQYAQANLIDNDTISKVERFDTSALFDGCLAQKNEMCGAIPAIIAMLAAKKLGADSVKVLKYVNSGDVTGDFSRVVGYLSAVIYKGGSSNSKTNPSENEEVASMLNNSQKKRLLQIARDSMETYVKTGKRITLDEKDPALLERQGAFVTLEKHGQLRGCIGHILPTWPLCQTVADMAIEAATGDPRFPEVTASELKDLIVEISVMTVPKEIKDINEIEVGKHGLIIRLGPYSGLLLPQVATEYGWNREEFLDATCQKAGIPRDSWKKGASILTFSAQVFGEE